ncbi:MAG: mechanosensitive ion channel domain-containing protein [Bacteroidota bacterium]
MIRLYLHIFLSFSITLFLILLEPLAKRLSMETNLFFDFLIHQSERLIIISVAWFLFTVLKLLKHILKSKYDINVEDNLKSRKVHTQINILERVVLSGIIIFAVGMLLLSFDKIREIGVALFASAGVAGIILGLAAQRVVGALLAGLQIAFTQPFRIEDAVIVEGEYGWVEEISLTYVVIRLWDKRRLVLPSTYFLDKPFQNWTRHTAEITGSVFLYTDYHVPFDALRAELTRLLEGSDLWDGQVNVLQVTNAKESNIEIRILVSAKTSPIAWDLRVYIREKMIEFIREHYPDSLPRTRIKLEEEAS